MNKILPFQNELQGVLPIVIGNAEYNNFKKLLFRIAELIELSGIEKKAIQYIIDEAIQVPSKSTLERYEKMFSENITREMNTILLKAAISPEIETEENRLKLEESVSLDEYFADSTAVKANIHYPVDWVLLRDATRTIMKAVKLIRKHGLKNRMDNPADFIKAVNKLCIEMTHTRGKKGIQDFMCPRSVRELQDRLKEDDFCEHQKRRDIEAETDFPLCIIIELNEFLRGNMDTGKPKLLDQMKNVMRIKHYSLKSGFGNLCSIHFSTIFSVPRPQVSIYPA